MHLLDRQGGQYHELRPGRTTIGSSPKCTLRLERPGVQPLHCLIVHGPEGISVRRWAPDARLNGVPFDDASIVAGDCLAIGGVEFELVKDTVDPADARQDAAAETFLDETDASCNRLMDAVQESVDAITEMETASDDEPTDVVSSAEVDTAADVAEPVNVVAAVPSDEVAGLEKEATVIETAHDLELNDAIDAAEANESTDTGRAEDFGGADEVGFADEIGESTEAGFAGFEAMSAQVETTGSAAAEVDKAAEIVFRELQSACAVARGRTRRMLGALRREREQNRELLERFTDIGQQLAQLKQQPPTSQPSGEFVANEFAKWQRQWEELRQQFAVWEEKLVEHTQRMAELQHELVETRDHRSTEVANVVPAVPVSSDTTVVIPAPEAEDLAAELVESTTDSTRSQDTRSELAAITAPESEPLVNPVAEVRRSHWLEGVVPRIEESQAVLEELPLVNDSAATSESPAEQWAAIVDEAPANEAAVEENTHEREPAASVESSAHDGEPVSVANEVEPWAAPAAESLWVTDRPDAESTGESELQKSAWTMPPLPLADESNEFDAGGEASAIEVEAPAWASGTTVEPAAGEDEASPFAEFSIWKQGASTEATTHSHSEGSDAADAVPVTEISNGWTAAAEREFEAVEAPQSLVDSTVDEAARASAEIEAVPEPVAEIPAAEPVSPRKSQPASFIDRYAHLFEESANDGSAVNPPVERPSLDKPVANSSGATSPFGTAGTEAAAQADEEESIEQYMAKLMQRVRGETATNEVTLPVAAQRSARPTSSNVPTSGNTSANAGRSSTDSVDGEVHDPTSDNSSATEAIVDWEAIARRAAAAAPKADMGALRALANETARRAIGRHELKKHRRDAMTKVIVSSLAGMTSLWLMLDSPSWLDVQFLTACVSLVAAAYWAGGTFKELLESMRAAAYDGPEKPQSDAGSALPPALPIDVEQ